MEIAIDETILSQKKREEEKEGEGKRARVWKKGNSKN